MCTMLTVAAGLLLMTGQRAGAAESAAAVKVPPPPQVEFAFEARVSLAPPVVLGETAMGRRQYIGITGGTLSGPKLTGQVMPGGWDYQLGLASGCNALTADYFLRAADGTVIHVLNQGFTCANVPAGERMIVTPRFEAPKGAHEWMMRATFVGTLEVERAPGAPANGPPAAVHIRFYQVK